MKVYVDKGKLESHDIQSITDLGGKEFQQVRMWFKDTDNVEILSLADYTKQVRNEVCEQVKTELLDISHEYWRVFKQNGRQYMTSDDMAEYLDVILDQIQGE